MFYDKLKKLICAEQIIIDELLSKHTSFKVGGPCDFFVRTKNSDEVIAVIRLCKEEAMPFFMLGNGSNLLVADEGFRGVVIHQEAQASDMIVKDLGDHCTVTADAGVNLCAFAMKISNLSLEGFEFAAGIPGTLGGAVYMNAGAYGGEIKDCIVSADVVLKDGTIKTLSKEELELSYRHSSVQDMDAFIISAAFTFKKGNIDEIRSKIEDFNQRRRDKQPLEYPSAGSTFKRPEGYFAGKLIEDAGLRGYRVGDAMVSEKHCGFVINAGNATAKDICQLMDDVSRIVHEKFGVTLEPEVKYIS